MDLHRRTVCHEPDDHPVAAGGSVAVKRARPGRPRLTELDRRWCLALHRHLQAAPFAAKPLLFATDASVGVAPPDVLVAA